MIAAVIPDVGKILVDESRAWGEPGIDPAGERERWLGAGPPPERIGVADRYADARPCLEQWLPARRPEATSADRRIESLAELPAALAALDTMERA